MRPTNFESTHFDRPSAHYYWCECFLYLLSSVYGQSSILRGKRFYKHFWSCCDIRRIRWRLTNSHIPVNFRLSYSLWSNINEIHYHSNLHRWWRGRSEIYENPNLWSNAEEPLHWPQLRVVNWTWPAWFKLHHQRWPEIVWCTRRIYHQYPANQS